MRSFCVLLALGLISADARAAEPKRFDVVVYGSTPSGVLAAVAASREGATVAVVEPMDWVGGMMTSGLSFSDSNQTARETLLGLFEEVHLRIEKHYADKGVTLPYQVRVKDQAKWTYEPHVADKVFRDMLREAKVALFLGQGIARLDKDGPRIRRLATTGGAEIEGRAFIDASYEGDLMARAGVRSKVGRETKEEHGESLAGHRYPKKEVAASPFGADGRLLPLMTAKDAGDPTRADGKIMVYSFRLCLTDDPANRVAIEKPADYDPARYELYRRAFAADPKTPFPIDLYPIPGGKLDGNNGIGKQFSIGLVGASVDWPEGSPERRRAIWEEHKSYTHGFLWFLAHDDGVPEPIRTRAQTLGLAKDEFPDHGHWPPVLYIREARRMVGVHVLTQADILTEPTKPDAVAVGSFPIDSHDCQRIPTPGGGFINEGTIFPVRMKDRAIGYPHHIPYRSLLPQPSECDNLLVPVCLSSTHVAFCSVRVEPTWMALGQSSGIAATLVAKANIPADQLPYDQLKARLQAAGVVLDLPRP
ncbi:FAD-dependent oxidoreductase [Tundrisphaera sp. TA3]|uniref:FAD-dependent oxidoreductase n=1 Tax=Tundrisphaera sp. TA3 TaxID=3435775 RepID=UPI003EB93049